MAKKTSISLFVIGMALVVIGCFLPLTATKMFGGGSSAFDAIKSSGTGTVRIGAILAFAGALAGIIFNFVQVGKGIPVKLISLIVTIAGGVYVAINYMNIGGLGKTLMKGFAKATGTTPGIGLIIIVIGWVVAIVGYLKNKD
ncbi:MAG: hypothetical protein KBT11_03830 [Treponema sp.]|nr:hypothetical protein [Candidatus Treponema equifaecale]